VISFDKVCTQKTEKAIMFRICVSLRPTSAETKHLSVILDDIQPSDRNVKEDDLIPQVRGSPLMVKHDDHDPPQTDFRLTPGHKLWFDVFKRNVNPEQQPGSAVAEGRILRSIQSDED
jgi:hypothetical protein